MTKEQVDELLAVASIMLVSHASHVNGLGRMECAMKLKELRAQFTQPTDEAWRSIFDKGAILP